MQDVNIEEHDTSHGLVHSELVLPTPGGYTALCSNADGSRTNLTLATPA
jgi:hypothetical protein